MRRLLPLLACLSLAPSAWAGTLYRCEGSDGVRTYSSTRISGAVCTVFDRSLPTPRHAVTANPPAARPTAARATPGAATAATPVRNPAQRVDFRTAPAGGTLTPSAPAAGARVTRGAVYKFERDGVTHYTNVRPPGSAQAQVLFSYIETCYACGVLPGVNFGTVALNTAAYTTEIRAAATEFGVDEAYVRAIIHAESAFRPNAVSNKGAQGLMQLMPGTAADMGVANAFDPAQNIRGGTRYLSAMLARYGQDLTLAAAAYNAGPGAVDRHGGVPPYAETQRYVQRVAQLADRYRGSATP